MQYPVAAYTLLMAVVLGYSFVTERVELAGCSGWRCRDEASVYVRGTRGSPADSRQETKRKLHSILSYHEKGAVWRRCVIIAAVLMCVAYVARRAAGCAGEAWVLVLQHLLFMTVLYFYWNYVNYHHFRVLKKHGEQLLKKL